MSPTSFATVNPSNGEQIETFFFYDASQIEKTLALADKSFHSFRKLPVFKRAQLLSQLAEALRKNKVKARKANYHRDGQSFSGGGDGD